MKQGKPIVAWLLSAAIIISCFAYGISAYAISHRLLLDVKYTDTINGEDDQITYLFTPELSGTYTFMSYNIPRCEAYLFVRESDPQQTQRVYRQLAYSQASPDYVARGQTNGAQFCLTYHLEAGTTYYYKAGWFLGSRQSGSMTVMLTCDEYDYAAVENIEVLCDAALIENMDGNWAIDADGESFFYYDYLKILQNMTLVVTYSDGSVSYAYRGASSIDGHAISYREKQFENHWYANIHPFHTSNTMLITILNKQIEYDVKIDKVLKCKVSVKVTDNATQAALPDASILQNGKVVAATNAQGVAVVELPAGPHQLQVTAPHAITREVQVVVSVGATAKDATQTPIALAIGDYNADGIMNAKDYGYALQHFEGQEKETALQRFEQQINFTADDYAALSL